MNEVGDMREVNLNGLENIGAIPLPPINGNVIFHVVGTMIQLLQIKGFFRGLS